MGASQSILALLLLLGACEAAVRVTVTVAGVAWETPLELPGGLNGTVQVERVLGVQRSIGECPAGRYCPAGTTEPVLCPAGLYSSQTRRSTVCPYKCFPNYYCPDPGKLLPCPPNTYSAAGASSQLGCRCGSGYQCTYRRSVSVNVGVGVPYTVWASPAGEWLRSAVAQAVAESAGVAVGSVSIKRVLPSVVGLQGGSRRLLGEAGRGGSMLSLSVEGARGVEGLRERLGRHRELGGEARVIWRTDERVYVVREPAGSWGQWQLFKRRAPG